MVILARGSDDALSSGRQRTVVLLLLALFCASGVFDHSLWTPNDSREGGMISEMARTGHWTALTLNGEPFLEKPPLLHWTALVVCALAGGVTPGLIRVPAAVFGFATALLVWAWGRRLGRERAGIVGALLCATNIAYYEYSRIVLTDICLTFAVAVSLQAFFSAYESRTSKGARYAAFLIATALSFYAKGLIGPVFVLGSVVVFLALKRRWKLACALSFGFVPVLAAAVYPWAAALYRQGGREYLISAFVDNQLGRFFKLPTGAAITALPVVGPMLGFMAERPVPFDPYFVHKEPIYYYLVKLPTRLLPWTLMAVPALAYWFRRDGAVRGAFATLLRCALVTMIVILHGASSKAGNYALPFYPILFLMVGVWCEDVGSAAPSRLEAIATVLTTALVGIVAVAAPVVYLALFALPATAYPKIERALAALGARVALGDPSSYVWLPGAGTAWLGAALCLAALPLSLWSLRVAGAWFAERDRVRGVLGLAATAAIVFVLVGTAAMPAYDRQRSYRPIAELVRDEIARGRRIALATHDAQMVGVFVFYADRQLPMVDPGPGTRAFLEAGPGASGVIVRRDLLVTVEASLRGVEHEVRSVPEDAGVNAREFCLITRG